MKKLIKLFLTAVLAFGILFGVFACALTDPIIKNDGGGGDGESTPPPASSQTEDLGTIGINNNYDYFVKHFGLPKDHVFFSLVYDEVLQLFSNTRTGAGDYVLFFGGAYDAKTKSVIAEVNAAAKQKGIKKVYYFEPQLDGGLSKNIVGTITGGVNAGRIGHTFTPEGGDAIDYLYDDFEVGAFKTSASATLLTKLNDALDGEKLTATDTTPIAIPTVLVASKAADTTTDNDTARKNGFYKTQNKAVLKPIRTSGYIGGATSATAYRNEVDAVLNQVTAQADFDVFTVKNQDFNEAGAAFESGGTTHLDYNLFFKTVTYVQLVDILEEDGEHVILFGGTWCPNTAALYYEYQNIAFESGYKGLIYLFDPRLDGASGDFNIRNNEYTAAQASGPNKAGTHARLYSNILDKYFVGYKSVWNSAYNLARNASGSGAQTSDMEFTIGAKKYTRMCVPNIFLYNKDVTGGIIDSFESELTWANVRSKTDADKEASAVLKLPAAGFDKDFNANNYNFLIISTQNLFAKAGLSYKFLSQGYNVFSYSDGLDVTLRAVRGDSNFYFKTYYNLSAAVKAEAELKAAGVKNVTRNNRAVTYGDDLAIKVFNGKVIPKYDPNAVSPSTPATPTTPTSPDNGGNPDPDC